MIPALLVIGGSALTLLAYAVGYEHGAREQFERDCRYSEDHGRLPIHANPTPRRIDERRARRQHPTSRGVADIDAALLGLIGAALIIGASLVFGGAL